MAVSVLANRIGSLSADDQRDVIELLPDSFATDDDEEKEATFQAFQEIMNPPVITVRRMEFPKEESDELRQWAAFISGTIREQRELAGLTQTQLAEKAGLPQSHISQLENGAHSPTFKTREKIAVALGIDPNVFELPADES